jgi:hypothetical protein
MGHLEDQKTSNQTFPENQIAQFSSCVKVRTYFLVDKPAHLYAIINN